MSEFASIIANAGLQQQTPDSQTALKSQMGGGKNFQEVLEKTNAPQEQNPVAPITNNQPTRNLSPAEFDAMTGDLMNRTKQIGAVQAPNSASDLLPDLFRGKTRLGLLNESMKDINSLPRGTELMGRLTQVEAEYNNLETLMKSNKDLSPGELLGLQARLYQVSQHIEVMSKVVDQVTGGIKTILNTNV